MEVWSVASWTDHLREVARLHPYRCEQRPSRYIAVDPH